MSLALAEPVSLGFSLADFELPGELRAISPPEARGSGRSDVQLLVAEASGITHRRFEELPDVLRARDVLVVNSSATVPASLPAQTDDGTDLVLNLSTELPGGFWIVEPREPAGPVSKPRVVPPEPGVAFLPEGGSARLLAPYPAGTPYPRLWVAQLDLPDPVLSYVHRHGEPIRYPPVDQAWPLEAYQTIFATAPGSSEMPSAARPFTDRLVGQLLSRGIEIAPIVLHTGVSSQERPEPPYAEQFEVSRRTAELVNQARVSGGRVTAAGTTVVRALETAADENGTLHPARGWTELTITPERDLRAVDGLLTGWHEPQSSHLDLLMSIGGEALIEESYEAALTERYLWHEFGDSHLILAPRSPR